MPHYSKNTCFVVTESSETGATSGIDVCSSVLAAKELCDHFLQGTMSSVGSWTKTSEGLKRPVCNPDNGIVMYVQTIAQKKIIVAGD